MRPIVIASDKPWNQGLPARLSSRLDYQVIHISDRNDLTLAKLSAIDPLYIFLPHWSYYVHSSIYERWEVVVFHMTDLPFGRGGSPLQNLIKRGFKSTYLCAVQCVEQIDAGDIYLKEPLSLYGSAEEIFLRADALIESMIVRILSESPEPLPQQGMVVDFQRRLPSQSNLLDCSQGDITQWYDQIRMLDAPGYPPAYLEIGGMRIEFKRVSQSCDGLNAVVEITPLDP